MKKFLPLSALIFFIGANPVARAETLEALRDQFKAEENRIVEYYDDLARQSGADKKQLTNLMKKALVENRKDFSALAGKDPRYSQAEVQEAFEGKLSEIPANKTSPGYIDEINAKLAEKGLKLKSTGGSADLMPGHINADIDTVIVHADGSPATPAEQLEGIRILEEHGINSGDIVKQNAARFDNKGKDLTAWKPETAEGQEAKITDEDAFKTEGGKKSTRNPGAVQDARGEVLDNLSKFEAARAKGDLKTQGKSLVKAGTGEASGVKVIDPKTGKVVRKSTFQKNNPDLYNKAKTLKDYGTTPEAEITEVGDSAKVKQEKIGQFQEEMASEMDALEKEGTRKGQIRDKVRENFQESYEKAGMTEEAQQIQNERARVQKSNQQAMEAIAEEQARPTAKDTYTGGRKGPGDAGYGEGHSAADARPAGSETSSEVVAGEGEANTRLVSDKSLAERRATMGGEKTPSLREGGKSSFADETVVNSEAKNALTRINEIEAQLTRVGELPASASGARVSFNAGAEKAMGAMAVVGTAYESGTIAAKLSKARILYEAAAKEKDDAMARSYFQQGEQLEKEATDQFKSALLIGGATIISPVVAGGALVGVGAYHGTRAVLENTETGKAIDEGVRGGMTGIIEGARDAATIASGQETYDQIAFDKLTERQSTWIEALRKEVIELEEGATVRDVMTLVERNQDRIASFQDLGYLKGVVRLKGSHPDGTGNTKDSNEEEQAKLLAQLQAMKSSIDALDGQAQAVDGEIASIEKTFTDEVKNLTKDLEKTSKDLMNFARDVSSLESLANKMDTKNAEASRASDDAYNAGAKCATARGAVENHATQTCQLAQAIKSTGDVQQLSQFVEQLRGEDVNTRSQSDIFRQELNNARMASRQAEGILKEIQSVRTQRETAKTTLAENENLIPSLQTQLNTLESQLASLQGKVSQLPDIVGQASGILGQAQAIDAKQLNKDGKKILKEIQGAFGRISKTATQNEKVFERNKDKLMTPKDKLKNATDELAQAKSRMESLVSSQISEEEIGKIQKFSAEARASYDAAQLFDDPVREAARSGQTCASEAEGLFAQKTSPEAQVAQMDCSQWPGTVAQWNSGKKAPECACTSGNLFDEELHTCVTEDDYYVKRTDCSQYGPAYARWDPSRHQAVCYCNDGYEFDNSGTTCRVSSQTQVAQADCSGYPGTVPAWDRGSESVSCDCPNGYQWNGSQCIYIQPQYPPNNGNGDNGDWGQVAGGLINTINQGMGGGGNSGGGNSGNGAGNPWGDNGAGGGTWGNQQPQGDPCEGNYYMNGYTMVCGCSGYAWSTSGNKCVSGGGGNTNDNGEGGTAAGFHGWDNDGGGSGATNTGGNWVNKGYTGGGSSGGVSTTPGGGSGTYGKPHVVCDPPATYDASCDCCICPGGHPDMYGQGCDYWEGSSR